METGAAGVKCVAGGVTTVEGGPKGGRRPSDAEDSHSGTAWRHENRGDPASLARSGQLRPDIPLCNILHTKGLTDPVFCASLSPISSVMIHSILCSA